MHVPVYARILALASNPFEALLIAIKTYAHA
jgi:hypothetical protein